MGEAERVYEQPAKQMPDLKPVRLKMKNLHLHASGVFSNVYKGTLLSPTPVREIAIKKTWPESEERKCLEMVIYTGVGRESHKNITQMLFAFCNRAKDGRRNQERISDVLKICEAFVFEYMPENLHTAIRGDGVDRIDLKIYTWQMFSGLKYLSAQNIVHRDLKPVNILVDPGKGLLRIGDFGSAKIIERGQPSTSYQVTRFYRPPELLLGSAHYDCTIDVWSAGCIVGEMTKAHVLWAGYDSKDQLKLVVNALGTPTEADYKAMNAKNRVEAADRCTGKGLAALFDRRSQEVVKFIARILVYKPKERLSGKELLKDAFFDSIFKAGAKRRNGMLVADCITKADRDKMIDGTPAPNKLVGILSGKVKMDLDLEPTTDAQKKESVLNGKNEKLVTPMVDPEGANNERKRKNTMLIKRKGDKDSESSKGEASSQHSKLTSMSMAPAAETKSATAQQQQKKKK